MYIYIYIYIWRCFRSNLSFLVIRGVRESSRKRLQLTGCIANRVGQADAQGEIQPNWVRWGKFGQISSKGSLEERLPGNVKKQAHISGSILEYVCVLNVDGSTIIMVDNENAATLRNQGKCQRSFFQGVTGGMFPEGSKCKRTSPAVFSYMFVFWMVTSPCST